MSEYYPLKFRTIFKDKIWGGQKVKTILGKDFSPLPNCGETWELSGVQGNISIVENGALEGKALTDLIEKDPDGMLGKKIHKRFGKEFPLLVKFIDANEDLSIQVHPDDEMARVKHNSFGKTEMWYILQADPGATLISGFNRDLDRETYQRFFDEGRLMEILNREVAETGDVFFLPAGRVHTIGKGLMIAEIQQTSDLTYRIYDFDRVDDQGRKRELHLEDALDAMDYKHYPDYKTRYLDRLDEKVELVSCPYFTTGKLTLTKSMEMDHSGLDCFKIYVCLEGDGKIIAPGFSENVAMGDVMLVPAAIEKYTLETSAGIKLLESYIK